MAFNYEQEYFGEPINEPAPEQNTNPASSGDEAPTTVTDGETAGPATDPGGGQGGPPIPSPPPSRPKPTAVPGIEGSGETGGVRGSFLQAGTSGFNQRFGTQGPANWFRRTLENLPNSRFAGSGRSGGGAGGGGLPSPSANPEVGGRPGDDDWQRFMQQVRRNMFG